MKTKYLCLALAVLFLAGCQAINRNYVVTATATVLGVQLAENPATQIPEAKFGYSRAEAALVPTNGVSVLMELRYSGIFSREGGIYQRLAVGHDAISQPGAALMFSKDNSGVISSNAVQAITGKIEKIPLAPR